MDDTMINPLTGCTPGAQMGIIGTDVGLVTVDLAAGGGLHYDYVIYKPASLNSSMNLFAVRSSFLVLRQEAEGNAERCHVLATGAKRSRAALRPRVAGRRPQLTASL